MSLRPNCTGMLALSGNKHPARWKNLSGLEWDPIHTNNSAMANDWNPKFVFKNEQPPQPEVRQPCWSRCTGSNAHYEMTIEFESFVSSSGYCGGGARHWERRTAYGISF
jgi:hypothetical protein